MDIKKINELMAKSKWTAMLGALELGVHTIQFPTLESLKSCKAIGYAINSDHSGRQYRFSVNKKQLTAIIKVEEE